MLKKTIQFTNFNEDQDSETLYFNLTKTELSENLHLKEELDRIQQQISGDKRELTTDEVQMILDLVKTLMRISYGVRSDDGKRFIKGEQVWTEFTQTAAYDAFLFSLFENPDNAVQFMLGIMPKDLRAEVEAMTSEGRSAVVTVPQQRATETVQAPALQPDENEPSDEELLKMDPNQMTQAQLMRAFKLKSQQ